MNSTAWEWRARLYDFCEASAIRRAPAKRRLFGAMRGEVLFVAAGTGGDFACFPPGMAIRAIDLSEAMLRRAQRRSRNYAGDLALVKADAGLLPFADETFDTAVTSCTLCSLPDPARALEEIRRVLKPGGRLLLFEHVRSRNPLLGAVLDLMTVWTRRTGTEMNRDTLGAVAAAGFDIRRVESVYLDIILSVRARKPRIA
ncbi:class I SAM-dependent methyltransferase [Candidatus Poribacteria bacterium]|nr:class I SAM-dependent methyltransferase [Candidatus Poribacteria bacterium]